MRKAFTVFILAGLLTSCRPPALYFATPDGPPDYQLGWQDGCDGGISAQGGFIEKQFIGFKKRPELIENKQYTQGWNDGFMYCRFYIASLKEQDAPLGDFPF